MSVCLCNVSCVKQKKCRGEKGGRRGGGGVYMVVVNLSGYDLRYIYLV